jgi:DNA-binding transcriptional LysR family regulator
MAINAPLQGVVFGTAARYFLEVARTGSILLAATELHVASSAISRQIAKLEQSVGCALFERRARGMQLSPAGAHLAVYLRNTSLDGERVLATLRDASQQAETLVRVACADGVLLGRESSDPQAQSGLAGIFSLTCPAPGQHDAYLPLVIAAACAGA